MRGCVINLAIFPILALPMRTRTYNYIQVFAERAILCIFLNYITLHFLTNATSQNKNIVSGQRMQQWHTTIYISMLPNNRWRLLWIPVLLYLWPCISLELVFSEYILSKLKFYFQRKIGWWKNKLWARIGKKP